jgi:predicted RNA-binding Zn ribbon-like protein
MMAGMDARRRLEQARERMPDLVVGGALCLDFANTVEPRGGLDAVSPAAREQANWRDYLHDYDDLVLWALLAGALSDEVATALLRRAGDAPEDAAKLFERAITLREAIYALFWRLAHGEEAGTDELQVVEREYRSALAGAELAPDGGGFRWAWREPIALDRPLGMVAFAAVELLLHDERERIKACPGVAGSPMACAWLFYDTSKNRSRHWCSMEDCGGVSKARRLTERRREQRQRKLLA